MIKMAVPWELLLNVIFQEKYVPVIRVARTHSTPLDQSDVDNYEDDTVDEILRHYRNDFNFA
jgi:hypothetical protein